MIQEPRFFSSDPRKIFSGLVICCCDDLPEPDIEAIYGATLEFGGQFRDFMTKEVTHVIALPKSNDVGIQSCEGRAHYD